MYYSFKYTIAGISLVLMALSCREKAGRAATTAKEVASCHSNLPSRFGAVPASLIDTVAATSEASRNGMKWIPGGTFTMGSSKSGTT